MRKKTDASPHVPEDFRNSILSVFTKNNSQRLLVQRINKPTVEGMRLNSYLSPLIQFKLCSHRKHSEFSPDITHASLIAGSLPFSCPSKLREYYSVTVDQR